MLALVLAIGMYITPQRTHYVGLQVVGLKLDLTQHGLLKCGMVSSGNEKAG
jgi:hypothetical protein